MTVELLYITYYLHSIPSILNKTGSYGVSLQFDQNRCSIIFKFHAAFQIRSGRKGISGPGGGALLSVSRGRRRLARPSAFQWDVFQGNAYMDAVYCRGSQTVLRPLNIVVKATLRGRHLRGIYSESYGGISEKGRACIPPGRFPRVCLAAMAVTPPLLACWMAFPHTAMNCG